VGFDADLALRPLDDGGYEGVISEQWWTPRGPLGGYVMALMQQAIVLTVDDESRQPRSLTVSFLRPPKAGSFTVHPVVERAGRSLTTATVRMEQEGKPLALGLATLSTPWTGPLLSDAPMPDVEPPGDRSAPPNPPPGAPGVPFRELVTMQKRFGPDLFSGADHAEAGGWLGLREERPVDALTVLILADAWFPTPWPRLDDFAPAPTVEMSIYFRASLPLPDSLLLGRFDCRLIRDGFFDENGELWAPDGTLVAQSRQLGLLLGAEASG
jgi:acyl-CoA thioesterase